MRRFLFTFLLALFLYLVLTAGSGTLWLWSLSELVAGVALSLLAAAVARSILCQSENFRMSSPFRLILIPLYLLGPFLIEVTKANLDVAWRVITLKIRPGIIRVKSGLKTDLGIFMLANSITLTPGTITVDIDEESNDLYVHNINVPRGWEERPVVQDSELFALANLPAWIRRIAE